MRLFRSVSLVFCIAWNLGAQTASPDQVTVAEAVQEAIQKNLELLASRYNVSVAEAGIVTARLRPNPVFSFGADYLDVLGTGFNSINNAGPSEVNFRTDFVLERGGKRDRRVAVAEDILSVAQLQLLNATRVLAYDVQDACVEVLLDKASLALAQDNLKAFNEIVDINTARVSAGDLAPVELVRSKVAALQYKNAVLQAESRLRQARNRLQTLLGRTAPSPTFDVTGELGSDGEVPSLETLHKMSFELRPDLKALEREQARSLADLRLQQAQGKVDYTVGVQYHRQWGNATGNALGLFFSAPLPVSNRNQGEIQRAQQEQRQVAARILALNAQIYNEVESAYLQYQTAHDLLTSIERDMLRQAQEVRQVTEYSYRRGEASFVEFLDAQRALNDTVQSYNEARAEYSRSIYLIDSISGKGVRP